jgi:hypothetical protein
VSDQEVLANAAAFRGALPEHFRQNLEATTASASARLDDAYLRLTSLQAWRTYVLESRIPASAMGFYSEAQNDGLTSLVLVAAGLWRPALKSQRSLIENVVHCFYYADHPVEYIRWERGDYRPTFKSLFDYFDAHPSLLRARPVIDPVTDLRKHYSALSDAVHSSSKGLRMTDDVLISNIWKTDIASLGKWSSMQKVVLRDVNLLITALMNDSAQGAGAKGLREALASVIPKGKDAALRAPLGVRIPR